MNWAASALVVSVLPTPILRTGPTSTAQSMQHGGRSMSNWAMRKPVASPWQRELYISRDAKMQDDLLRYLSDYVADTDS